VAATVTEGKYFPNTSWIWINSSGKSCSVVWIQ